MENPENPTLTIVASSRIHQGQEAIEYAKRKGLCTFCGVFQTHKKVKRVFRKKKMVPMTITSEKGDITVYKGHCISATCYQSVEQVKILLGEMEDDSMPSAPSAPSSRKVNGEKHKGSTRIRASKRAINSAPSLSTFRSNARLGKGGHHAFGNVKLRVNSTNSKVGSAHSPPRASKPAIKNPPSLPANEKSPPANSNFKKPPQAPNLKKSPPAPPSEEVPNTKTPSSHTKELQNNNAIMETPAPPKVVPPQNYNGARSVGYSSGRSNGDDGTCRESKPAAVDIGAAGLKKPPPPASSEGGYTTVGVSKLARSPSHPDEHPILAEFRASLSEGNYIKFLNDIGQRGNLPELVIEGFALFCKKLSQDQLVRPKGVVLAGPNWMKAVTIPFERFKREAAVVISGLVTMTTLANLPGPYKAIMAKRKAVDIILKVLDDFAMDESVICAACGLINALSMHEREGLNGKHENVTLVIIRMIQLLHSEVGNRYAIPPLRNFARQRKKLIETNRSPWLDVKDGLESEQGTSALIRALQSINLEGNIAEAGLTLMWRLSVPSDEMHSPDSFPATEDVMQTITRCMEKFNVYGVILAGSRTLANLALRISFPSKYAASAIAPIKQFLRENPRELEEEMVICALHSFCNFSANTSSRTAITIDSEAMKATLSMIVKFPHNPAVVEVGCLTIAYACAHDVRTKHSVLEIGGLEVVGVAFVEHLQSGDHELNLDVKDSIYCAIASLSGCARGALQIKQSSLLGSIHQALSVEMDVDFRSVLEVVIKNTNAVSANHTSAEVASAPITQLHQQPKMFSTMLQSANNERSIVDLLKDLCLLGETGLECYAKEGFSELTSIMTQMSNSQAVQEQGCKALAIAFYYLPFTQIDAPIQLPRGGWAVVHQRQTMDCMQHAIRIHQNSLEVQRHAFRAMTNFLASICELDVNSIERIRVGQWLESCLNDVLDSLNENTGDIYLQKLGMELFWIIFSLVSSEVLQRWKLRALQRIFDTTRQLRDNDEILKLACDALMGLKNDPESLNFMGESIIVQMLDSVLSSDVGLVERTSSVLAILLKNVFVARGHALQYPNVTHLLISCMTSNRSNCTIQINITSSLESLINFEDVSFRASIALDGGVEALCNALRTHGRDPGLAEFACGVLSLVIPSSGNAVTSMRNMLSVTLIQVLRTHTSNFDATAAILDALWTCCSQDDYFKNEVMRQDVLSSVIQVMKRQLGSSEVQRSGCGLLWVLSSNGNQGKETIGVCGGVPAVVNALLAHSQSTTVQKEGLAALKNLATMSDNKQAIEQVGGEDAVLYALWIHYKDPQVVSSAYSALNNIAVDSPTKSAKLMNEKTFENSTSVMKRFSSDESVQKNVCSYLKSCSCLPGNLELIARQDKLVPLLQVAAEKFPVQCGDQAIGVISKIQNC